MQYVYLIKCADGLFFYFKVGVANDVDLRLAQLQTGNPLVLSLVDAYGFDNAEIVERAIHQAWKKERIRGEWFRLSPVQAEEDFSEICRVLGGDVYIPLNESAPDSDVEDAENILTPSEGGKWDFAAMFADGWRMAATDGRCRYWCWRKRLNGGDELIYGGTISSLPYPLEEMRRVFRDGVATKEG